MTRLVRLTGFLLIAAGAVVALTWFIEPLRAIWPWLRKLPLAIQIGLGAAAFGFVLVLASMLWERFEDREQDQRLKDEL
jgi:hypothetical protein